MSDPTTTSRTGLRRTVDRALIAAGVVILLALTGAVTAFVTLRDRQHEVTDIYYTAVTEADAAYVQMVDAETAVRGYLLTGDPVVLEPLTRLQERPASRLDVAEVLEERYGAEHGLVQARSDATDAARRWYVEFAEPAIERVQADGVGAVTIEEVAAGGETFAEVRAEIERYTSLLDEGRADAATSLRSATYGLAATIGALALIAVVGGALLWVFLRRWVLDPLAGLAEDARRVADGDVRHHVRRSGPGEIGQVGQDVEQMRGRLVELLTEAGSSRAALEESHALLEAQTADLSRSNRDLEQFAYVASHDLQEPLRKVASFTQLLAKRYEGQLDERADQYIAYAVDGAKRMQRLINDLLGFSRVGRIGGELSEVDMGAVVRLVVGDLEDSIEQAGATVTAEDLPVVVGEEPLLVQLVHNLVGNALKFRHAERAPVVRFEARQLADSWEFACHDNGIGIDRQYAERVFVIFQRLHAKDVYEGTGIGLALGKKIVEYHGGDIWVDPDAVEGTTIRWTLPIRAEAQSDGQGGDPDGSPHEMADAVGQEEGT